MTFSTKKETKFDSVGGCVSTCFLHTEGYFWEGAMSSRGFAPKKTQNLTQWEWLADRISDLSSAGWA